MTLSFKHLMLVATVAVVGATPVLAQDATTPVTGGEITTPGTPDGRPIGDVRQKVRDAVKSTAQEVREFKKANPGQPLPPELQAKVDKGAAAHDKMHSIREGREDRRDVREDTRDDKYQGGRRDVREDRRDLRDDKRDGRRDGRYDRRSDRRDGRRAGGFNN